MANETPGGQKRGADLRAVIEALGATPHLVITATALEDGIMAGLDTTRAVGVNRPDVVVVVYSTKTLMGDDGFVPLHQVLPQAS